ncbi:hypothetical protein [Imhoffiella purpurea]|uniref:Uncharacterized protein n=1 Tax=Imhoffiella purpurea TaxID=1249627 RepID=W9VM60_9GAMM|nr:hypothetical protein [Imhoffiella purpurea]EXJ17187.1 hypothetical protein D779_0014 [Imhoffiella purpurea]
MFAKSTLASAVAAAIGVSAVGIAQADSVFFPQVVLSDTVTTIASVINTTDNNWDQAGQPAKTHLHYRFYYKAGEDVSNPIAPCEEYDEYLPTSIGDIQTIDLSGHFGADTAGVLFNDPSVNNKWAQSNRDYAFGRYLVPARGYLYVDNNDNPGLYQNPGDDADTLYGEAFVFEFGSGAAWGYQAYEQGSYFDATGNLITSNYTYAASETPSHVALMPFDEITTAFFVTPVSVDQAPDISNDYRGRIEFFTSGARGDVYDRDENRISGTVPMDVVCVARIDAGDLVSDGTLARIIDGGWGALYNYRLWYDAAAEKWRPTQLVTTATTDDESLVKRTDIANTAATAGNVVIKLEYNLGNTFNGESVGGVYNNAIMYHPE